MSDNLDLDIAAMQRQRAVRDLMPHLRGQGARHVGAALLGLAGEAMMEDGSDSGRDLCRVANRTRAAAIRDDLRSAKALGFDLDGALHAMARACLRAAST